MIDTSSYSLQFLKSNLPEILQLAEEIATPDDLRQELSTLAHRREFTINEEYETYSDNRIIRVRDCARTLIRILSRRSEDLSGFSFATAIWDIAHGNDRPDLEPGFFAEVYHLFRGALGKRTAGYLSDTHLEPSQHEGRAAAMERSDQLDALAGEIETRMRQFPSGLEKEIVAYRQQRQERVMTELGISSKEWNDWSWQAGNVIRDKEHLQALVPLSQEEMLAVDKAKALRLPFGITPHYLTLMDESVDSTKDLAVRAQVIPPLSYVNMMAENAKRGSSCLDFMRENDTSPIDLITRRYPNICILKPFNTCPQICVYCQRNWEIEDAMAPGALAPRQQIEDAIQWIASRPSIHEVLITGGDPLAMADADLERVIAGVAGIPSIERIRIGTRTLVTMPMRFTEDLTDMLARYRAPGVRQLAVVTHIQHPYEITPETAAAVERLRVRGIPVYNQLVYNFYVSRRFEAVRLRRLLSRIGIEPYYSFNTKGKEETLSYRVPIARLLQEQKEEARLLPGLSRTDEAVYNVPGMGKNYLRAIQHRDLIAILPDGTRLYEFHPWEKNISRQLNTYISEDVPILDYLQRLERIGENPGDYESIWYYY